MKKLFLTCLLFEVVLCFSQENIRGKLSDSYAEAPANSIRIAFPQIEFDFFEPNKINKTGYYQIDDESGISFITINWNNKSRDRYLIVYDELICEIFGAKRRIFSGNSRHILDQWIGSYAEYSATSYLVEGNNSYSPTTSRPLWKPLWVEGAEGQGIHEKLFIKARDVLTLHISIGYVSFDRPQLYKENSRPKKIRLAVKNKYSLEFNLEDTANYQPVTLPGPLKREDTLELEILEVYPGTKYEDTCINEIVYDVVPWGQTQNP
jgi:hypothetical protein